MKKICVFIFLFFSLFSNAQINNEISVGIGPSFFGWGDVSAVALTTTYSYSLSKHFEIEPRLILSTGWNQDKFSFNSGEYFTSGYNYSQTSYMAAAASVVYTPFNGWADFFKIKSGLLLGTIAHSHGYFQEGAFPSIGFDFGKYVNKGFIHTICFRILDKQRYFLGTELSMLTSFYKGSYDCDGFVWNFKGGVKF